MSESVRHRVSFTNTEAETIIAALMAVERSGGGSTVHSVRQSVMRQTGLTEDGTKDIYDTVAQMRATVLREIADEVES